MKTRKRKVFERVVNPLLIKHLVSRQGYTGSCIASNIPIKYLNYLVVNFFSFKRASEPSL